MLNHRCKQGGNAIPSNVQHITSLCALRDGIQNQNNVTGLK